MEVESHNNFKKVLEAVMIKLNDLLTEQIRIHNALFNPPLRAKIPIPFIMKKIDFEGLYHSCEGIKNDLKEYFEGLKVVSNNGTDAERTICGKLREYMICFFASNSKLTEITYKLHLKARNENKLTYKEHTRLVKEYQENEEQRLAKGDMMNELFQIVSGL